MIPAVSTQTCFDRFGEHLHLGATKRRFSPADGAKISDPQKALLQLVYVTGGAYQKALLEAEQMSERTGCVDQWACAEELRVIFSDVTPADECGGSDWPAVELCVTTALFAAPPACDSAMDAAQYQAQPLLAMCVVFKNMSGAIGIVWHLTWA